MWVGSGEDGSLEVVGKATSWVVRCAPHAVGDVDIRSIGGCSAGSRRTTVHLEVNWSPTVRVRGVVHGGEHGMERVEIVFIGVSWISGVLMAEVQAGIRSRGFRNTSGQVTVSTDVLEDAHPVSNNSSLTSTRVGDSDVQATVDIPTASRSSQEHVAIIPFAIAIGIGGIQGNAIGHIVLSEGADLHDTDQSRRKGDIGAVGSVMLKHGLGHRREGIANRIRRITQRRRQTVGRDGGSIIARNNINKGSFAKQAILLDAVSSDERTAVTRARESTRLESFSDASVGVESSTIAGFAVVDNAITAPVVAGRGHNVASGAAGDTTSIKATSLAGDVVQSGAIALLAGVDITIPAFVAGASIEGAGRRAA